MRNLTAFMMMMSELGTGEQILCNFRSGAAFASWLGLCPNNKITGGRIIQAKTRKVANKVAQALRMAALGLSNSKSELGVSVLKSSPYRVAAERLRSPACPDPAHPLPAD